MLFYFLNEQFDQTNIESRFMNLIDIFNFLKTIDIVYNFKQKYLHTLYSEKYVNNNENIVYIYQFKLALLVYIAFTK